MVNNALELDRIAVLRGLDWDLVDTANTLIISAGCGLISRRPWRASLMRLDVVSGRVQLVQGDSIAKVVAMNTRGVFWSVPDDIVFGAGLGNSIMVLASTLSGILDGQATQNQLQDLVFTKSHILGGATEWDGDTLYASPLGQRLADGTWVNFAPSGERGGIIIPKNGLESIHDKGFSFATLSDDVKRHREINILVEGLRQRVSENPVLKFQFTAASNAEAILAVALRMAFPKSDLYFALPESLGTAWRRLVQHLGASPCGEEQSCVKLTSLLPVLKWFKQDRLISEINHHSQVIPESICGKAF